LNTFFDYVIGAIAILAVLIIRSRSQGDLFYVQAIKRLLGLRD